MKSCVFLYDSDKLHYICMYMTNMFSFISGGEIIFILFIVVMVFGADRIPEIARGLGKGMRQLKDATNEVKAEIQRSAEKQGLDTDFTKDIKDQVGKVKDDI